MFGPVGAGCVHPTATGDGIGAGTEAGIGAEIGAGTGTGRGAGGLPGDGGARPQLPPVGVDTIQLVGWATGDGAVMKKHPHGSPIKACSAGQS